MGLVIPVAAAPPDRTEVPLTAFTIPAGPTACSFDVLVEPLSNKEKQTTFYDQAGNTRVSIISGGLKVRLTNLSNGKTSDLNISGPTLLDFRADGSIGVVTGGPVLWWFFEPGVAPGQPNLGLYHGRTVSEFDTSGNYHFLKARGHVEDLCVSLASN
jgi:hypothetical protein